jgi:hypothetical protein
VAQAVERLLCKYEALSSNHSCTHTKKGKERKRKQTKIHAKHYSLSFA